MNNTARIVVSWVLLAAAAAGGSAHGAVSHFYGGTQVITGSGYVHAEALSADPAGNVYLAGNFDGHNGSGGTTDFDPGPGSDSRTPASYDAYVTKHGPDGSYLWTAVFSAPGAGSYVRIEAVSAAPDGAYVTGLFAGTASFAAGGGRVLHATGGANRFVAKLTPAGATAWALSNGLQQTAGIDTRGTVLADGGGVYVSGIVDGTGQALDFDPSAGTDVIAPTGGAVPYITRLDADGGYAWTRVLNGTAPADTAGILQMSPFSGGGFTILASFHGDITLDPAADGGVAHSVQGRCVFHEFLARFDAAGAYAGWALPVHPDYNGFATDDQGNVYLTGPYQQRRQYNPFYCERRGGPSQAFYGVHGSAVLTRINGDGTYGWTRPFFSVTGDRYSSGVGARVLVDSTGAPYVAGYTPDPATDAVSTDPVFLTRFSDRGVMSWLRSFGAGSVADAAIDTRNTIYVAGDFQQPADFNPDGGDVKQPAGYSSVYLSDYYFNPYNTAPVAHDAAMATDQNVALTATLDASDAEHDALTYAIASPPQHGIVTVTNVDQGVFLYRPRRGYSGPDSFTFVANDQQYNSNAATVSVTVKQPVPGVDLIVTALNAPAGANPGQRLVISATATNAGIQTSSTTRLGIYLSTDSTITTGDRLLGTVELLPLYANRSMARRLQVSIPADAAVGHYYIGAIADDTHVVPESNEGNNTLAAPFAVTLPDLAVTAIHGPAGALKAGGRMLFTVDYRNGGTSAAGNSRLELVLSDDSAISAADTYVRTAMLPGLPAGASGSVTLLVRVPLVTAGSYYLGAIANATGTVTESDGTNNTGALPVSVVP